MNRAKFVYESVVGTCALFGGVVGSSTFAYESRHDGFVSMFGASVFGGAAGILAGAIAGASTPIAVPGVLIATAFSLSDYGSKKLIDTMNEVVARPNGSNQAPPGQASLPGQALPPGSPSAPVSI